MKRDIQQVIEASTLAYDQRDEAHSKIFLLKEKSEKDLQLFSAEIKVRLINTNFNKQAQSDGDVLDI